MLKEQVLWAVVVLFLVIAMMGIALREVCRYTKCVIYRDYACGMETLS